jgi:hypothetical protein
MADSDALRARRARLHRHGDHSLCLAQRCTAAEVRTTLRLPEDPDPGAGPVEASLRVYAEALHLPADDARAPMVQVAIRLGQAIDAGQNLSAASGQLHQLVRWMGEFQAKADQLDGIRTRVALKQVDSVLRAVT